MRPDDTELTFADWKNLTVDETLPLITPDENIKKITTAEVPFLHEYLLPIEIENPASFKDWVGQQAERPDILHAAGVADVDEATAHQLIDIAVGIVTANVSYMDHDEVGDDLEHLLAVYKMPVDVVLANHIPVQCDGYSAATAAVFKEMKDAYPEQLKNTYIVTHSAEMAGHAWDLVISVEGPNEAKVAFLDPTAADPDPGDYGYIDLNYPELIEGLEEKGIIDKQTFYALALQYEQAGNMTDEELLKVLTYGSFGVSQIDPARPDKSFVQLAEDYLARFDNDSVSDETPSFEQRNGVYFASIELHDYYTNPNAVGRPEDWHERALRLAGIMAASDPLQHSIN